MSRIAKVRVWKLTELEEGIRRKVIKANRWTATGERVIGAVMKEARRLEQEAALWIDVRDAERGAVTVYIPNIDKSAERAIDSDGAIQEAAAYYRMGLWNAEDYEGAMRDIVKDRIRRAAEEQRSDEKVERALRHWWWGKNGKHWDWVEEEGIIERIRRWVREKVDIDVDVIAMIIKGHK